MSPVCGIFCINFIGCLGPIKCNVSIACISWVGSVGWISCIGCSDNIGYISLIYLFIFRGFFIRLPLHSTLISHKSDQRWSYLSHTRLSEVHHYSLWAFQPLIFIRIIETRYYETDDPDYYATALTSFAVYEKAELIKKNLTSLQGYKVWGKSRTPRFSWVPTNQAKLGTTITSVPNEIIFV